MVATSNETIQNATTVGQGWKTISMRLRGLVAEEDEDGNTVWEPAKLGKLIEETTAKYTADGVGVSILADDGNFKSTYEIIRDIAEVWNDMSSKDQSAIMERAAGKHRATVFAAAVSDVERLEEALKTAENSAGSALEEFEKRTTSVEYALGRLNATWQEFSMNTIPKETIVDVINFGTSILEAAQEIGALKLALGALGGMFGIFAQVKLFPYLENIAASDTEVKSLSKTFSELSAEYKEAGSASAFASGQFKKFSPVVQGLGKVVSTALVSLAKSVAMFAAIGIATKAFTSIIELFRKQKHIVSDLKTEVDELKSSLDSLKSEYDDLSSKAVLTSAEKQRLEYLEKQIKLEERSLELKKEQYAREFIKSSGNYFSGNGNIIVDSEFKDAMDKANDVIFDYNSNLELIGRRQETVDRLTTGMEGLAVGTVKYQQKLANLEDKQLSLSEAEAEQDKILEDMRASLSTLYDEQANYTIALQYCTEEERKGLLQGKAKVDSLVRQMEVILGVTSSYEDLEEEVSKVTPKVNMLKSALDKATETKKLTYEEVDALKREYPELGEKILETCESTADGFVIEGEALEALQDAYGNTKSAQLQAQIEMCTIAKESAMERIELYKQEAKALLTLFETMLSTNKIGSADSGYQGMGYNPVSEALANATEEEKEAYFEYQKAVREARKAQEEIDKLQSELDKVGSKKPTKDGDTPLDDTTSGAVDIFDKYANALAKAREEIERYGAAVELTQAQLDLNQSQEERSVELLGEEQELYGKLLETQQARYKIVNDTLWLQQQQLKAVKEEASQKVSAKLGTDVDVSNWTQADVEEFVYNLKVDTSKADADLANFLNAMIEMQGDVDSLYVDWYNMKKEIRETELEHLQKVIDFQNDSLEQFDDARKQTEKILSLLEEVEDTGDERLNIVKNLSDSYEGQKETIMAMHQANVAQMHELAQDMERNQQAYNRLVEQNQKLEEDYLDVIQAQLNYKQQQIDLEQELAEKRAESEIYGDKGKDRWEDARQDEIDALNDQIDELNKKAEEDDFAEQMAEYEKDIAEKEQEIADLYKKLDNLRSQKTVQTLEQQADGSFQWKYVEDQIAINETLEEIADKEVEIEELKNEKKEAEEKRALEEEIAHLEAQIEAIEDEVERRQQLFDEELQVIEDTYQKEKTKLAQWLQDEITHWQKRVAENEKGLTDYDAMNTEGWNKINTNTDTALTDLEGTYDLHFQNIVDIIGGHAATAIAHINAIAAAQREAADAAREAADARASADSADGSAAMGLRFVEANNYVARLHYGERVLTRQEAQQYNELEDDIKSGHLKAYFDSMKQETADRISTGIGTSVARIGSSVPMAGNNNSTSFVIEHLELPNVQDAQDFANVLQRWAKQEFGGLVQKAKIVKAR